MTSTIESAQHPGVSAEPAGLPLLLSCGGLASIGAGLVHAVAIGVHTEHHQAVVMFTAVALFQVGWGILALLVREPARRRVLALIGLLGNAALVVGFIMAKTSGIAFIDGMESVEAVQFADGMAAGLAAVAVILVAGDLLRPQQSDLRKGAWALGIGAVVVAALTVPAMVSAADGHVHEHGGSGGHHDTVVAGSADHHAVDTAGSAHHDEADAEATGGHHGTDDAGHGSAASHAPTVAKPYDPALPVNLGGVEGVTPAQQAAAERIVSATLLMLPKWSDPAVAEAAGFRSIGDGYTGHEHFVNRAYMSDGRVLDPSVPESLVYDTSGTGRVLVAAMYMAEPGTTLETAPDFGGALTQWHIHANLCFQPDGSLAGITRSDGSCPAPLVKSMAPMIHVWITTNECGPFASLEGVGAGQVKAGETRACDSAHGGH